MPVTYYRSKNSPHSFPAPPEPSMRSELFRVIPAYSELFRVKFSAPRRNTTDAAPHRIRHSSSDPLSVEANPLSSAVFRSDPLSKNISRLNNGSQPVEYHLLSPTEGCSRLLKVKNSQRDQFDPVFPRSHPILSFHDLVWTRRRG